MKTIVLLSAVLVLLASCGKDKVTPQQTLTANTKYISSTLKVNGKPRIFVLDKEVFNDGVIDSFKIRYPGLFLNTGTEVPFSDTIIVNQDPKALMKHIFYDSSYKYSISYSGSLITFNLTDSVEFDHTDIFENNFTWLDGAMNSVLNRSYINSPFPGNNYGTPRWLPNRYYHFENEYATFSGTHFTHVYANYSYQHSGFALFSGRCAWGINSGISPAVHMGDTLIVQEATAEYIPN